jgi:hypothetical protein
MLPAVSRASSAVAPAQNSLLRWTSLMTESICAVRRRAASSHPSANRSSESGCHASACETVGRVTVGGTGRRLRRSARSRASADMCAAIAQPRILATTSVRRAATRSGAAIRPTADPCRSSGSSSGQRISAMVSAAVMTWLATVRSCVRSTSVRPPMPHADRSVRRHAEVIHRLDRKIGGNTQSVFSRSQACAKLIATATIGNVSSQNQEGRPASR